MFVDAKQSQGIYCLQVLMNEGIDRRRRFIATVACSLGIGVIINPGWATDNLWVATATMPSGVRAVRYTRLSPNTLSRSCRYCLLRTTTTVVPMAPCNFSFFVYIDRHFDADSVGCQVQHLR